MSNKLRPSIDEVHGAFVHDAFAIGMRQPLAEALEDINDLPYPLNLEDESQLSRFSNALVLYHETAHFAQFISSGFGLEMARLLHLAYAKHMRFAYQFEHRFVAMPPKEIVLSERDLSLGPIRDLATLYEA
jgi:hypothetical protein